MAQLEPWEKVFINSADGFEAIDPTHARIGCVTCHGGTEPVVARSENINDLFLAMMEAHDATVTYTAGGSPDRSITTDHDMMRDPSAAPEMNCNGAACHSEHDAVSGVLAAMGVDAVRAAGAVRLSVGGMTTLQEVDQAARGLIAAWRRLRSMDRIAPRQESSD